MSRNIDPNRPYTDEEKDWLRTRAAGEGLIQLNERRFADVPEEEKEAIREEFDADAELDAEAEAQRKQEEEEEFDEEDIQYVSQMKTHEVKAKLRELGHEPVEGKANDLKLQLLEILDAARGN